MKSLKSHLSLIIALFAILFSIESFLMSQRILELYQKSVANDYSMIVVSEKQLEAKQLEDIKYFSTLEELSTQMVLDQLKDDISKISLELLKTTLPKFYELKLSDYPDGDTINSIKDKLLSISGVTKVENFSQTHKQIYILLQFTQSIIYFFSLVMFVIGLLLFTKEMRLWQYVHEDRMSIMALFGAPIMLRSAILFKFAFLDSIIALLLMMGIFWMFESYDIYYTLQTILNINQLNISYSQDLQILAFFSFSISFGIALFVMLNHTEKELQ